MMSDDDLSKQNFIHESLTEAGFSATYESDRLHAYTKLVVARHLAEFYAVRFDMHGADVYTQIQSYLDLKFNN